MTSLTKQGVHLFEYYNIYFEATTPLPLNLSSKMNYTDNFGVYEIVLISFRRNLEKNRNEEFLSKRDLSCLAKPLCIMNFFFLYPKGKIVSFQLTCSISKNYLDLIQ